MNTNKLSLRKFFAVQIITITSLQGMEQKLAKMPYHPLVQQKTNTAINKKLSRATKVAHPPSLIHAFRLGKLRRTGKLKNEQLAVPAEAFGEGWEAVHGNQPLKDIKNLIPGLKVLPKEIVENYVLPYVGLQGINNYVWAQSLKIAKTYIAHKAAISSVQYSPDNRYLLTTHRDGEIRLLNAQNGNEEDLPKCRAFSHAQFTPDSLKIGICGGKYAGIIDIRRNVYTKLLGHTGAINTLRFNDDGNQTITASDDWSFRIWDTDSGKELQKCSLCERSYDTFHYFKCKDAAFVSQKNNIIVALSSCRIHIFNRYPLEEIHQKELTIEHDFFRLCAQHPYNHEMLIIQKNSPAFLYNYDNQQIKCLSSRDAYYYPKALYFNHDGTTLFEYESKNPSIYDIASEKIIGALENDKKEPICAANFNISGDEIITGDKDGKICVWQTNVTVNQDQATLLLALKSYKEKNSIATFRGFCDFCDIDANTLATILNSFDDESQAIIKKIYPFVIDNFKTTSIGVILVDCMSCLRSFFSN